MRLSRAVSLLLLPAFLVALVAELPSSCLSSRPAPSSAVVRRPERCLHGYDPGNIAVSPVEPSVHFLADSSTALVAVSAKDGRVLSSAPFPYSAGGVLFLTVDRQSQLYVSRQDLDASNRLHWRVDAYSPSLELRRTVDLRVLKPAPSMPVVGQMAVDSLLQLYLYDGYQQLWQLQLNGSTERQVGAWAVAVPPCNDSSALSFNYIFIDRHDVVHVQATGCQRWHLQYSTDGELLHSFPIAGTGTAVMTSVDVAGNTYMLESNGTLHRFDSQGQHVASFLALPELPNRGVPRMTVDGRGNVLVVDVVNQCVRVLDRRGRVVRVYKSPLVPLGPVQQLLVQPDDGDGRQPLVAFSGFDSSILPLRYVYPARQVARGRLLVNYSLPDAAYRSCSAVAADVGSRSGRLYLMLQCRFWPQPYLLLLFDRHGQLAGNVTAQPGAGLFRVDEERQLLWMAEGSNACWQHRTGCVLYQLNLTTGTVMRNITSSSALWRMNDIAGLAISPYDGSVVVVSAEGSVLWRVLNNGSVEQSRVWLAAPGPSYAVNQMAVARRSDHLFVSMTASNVWVNGSWRAGSLVLETTRNGSLVAQYGSVRDWDQAQLDALTVGTDGSLYVYCNAYNRMLVYDNVEERTEAAAQRGAGRQEDGAPHASSLHSS